MTASYNVTNENNLLHNLSSCKKFHTKLLFFYAIRVEYKFYEKLHNTSHLFTLDIFSKTFPTSSIQLSARISADKSCTHETRSRETRSRERSAQKRKLIDKEKGWTYRGCLLIPRSRSYPDCHGTTIQSAAHTVARTEC